MSPDTMRQHAEAWRKAYEQMARNASLGHKALLKHPNATDVLLASALSAILADFAGAMVNSYVGMAKEVEDSEI